MTKTDSTVAQIIAKLRMKKMFNGDVISQAINTIERLNEQLVEARQRIEELERGKQE